MKKKTNIKVLKFPNKLNSLERQIEAILFAADEPLDEESIQERLSSKTSISKVLESLKSQYETRGINLVCISNKWSFRTASDLNKLMTLQKSVQKKL